jgi:hypothetical protein
LRKFLSEVVSFFPELQADAQNLEELKGSSMLRSEGSSSLSGSESPAAGRRNDAHEGEGVGPTPVLGHKAKGEDPQGEVQ